jgi:membrane protein DedA with SNARE-associated domain
MHFFTLTDILHLLMTYRYVIIFPISIIEGPIITILSGLLVSLGQVNLYVVFGVLVAGDVIGDCVYYGIGRYGRNPAMKYVDRFFKIDEDKLPHFEKRFKSHETSILLLGKTQPIGSVVLATAGFVKMDFRKFVLVSLLGTMIKTAILLAVGFYFGKAYNSIDNYITKVSLILFLILVIGGFIYYMSSKSKQLEK